MQTIYTSNSSRKIRLYGIKDIDRLPQLRKFAQEERLKMKAVAQVLPFRANNYVVENLIDWSKVPHDPLFRLTFPQPEMLTAENLDKVIWLLQHDVSPELKSQVIHSIRMQLNPHPAGQAEYNIPTLDGQQIPGIQHKYPETVLVFPTAGQTCHAYCTFCFRWSQFVTMGNVIRFATHESQKIQAYIQRHKEVTDILITGGDPLVMKAHLLALYIEPFLNPQFEHIKTIRIGTKSLSYWPYRYISDDDADEILRLFEKVRNSGKRLAIMAHVNHWLELNTPAAREAIQKILSTGAIIRTQAPLLKGINDSTDVWIQMWQEQASLGCEPYYMFIPRNTGAKHYFAVPLVKAWNIFQDAYQKISGLERNVRGPIMSTLPGKVLVHGVSEAGGEKVFHLSFVQGRKPNWCLQPFLAKYDAKATWFGDLVPAFGQQSFFYEAELTNLLNMPHVD